MVKEGNTTAGSYDKYQSAVDPHRNSKAYPAHRTEGNALGRIAYSQGPRKKEPDHMPDPSSEDRQTVFAHRKRNEDSPATKDPTSRAAEPNELEKLCGYCEREDEEGDTTDDLQAHRQMLKWHDDLADPPFHVHGHADDFESDNPRGKPVGERWADDVHWPHGEEVSKALQIDAHGQTDCPPPGRQNPIESWQ